jgi:hypothetical protein
LRYVVVIERFAITLDSKTVNMSKLLIAVMNNADNVGDDSRVIIRI